jgi:hypothetical protein
MALVLVFLSGVLFALGLGISGMTQPEKVSSFLNISGNWDPSLILVMLGASATYFLGHATIYRHSVPALFSHLLRGSRKELGLSLIGGSALFGIGWGMIGFCPGPALVALVTGYPPVIVFVLSMTVGMFGYNALLHCSSTNLRKDETLAGYIITD